MWFKRLYQILPPDPSCAELRVARSVARETHSTNISGLVCRGQTARYRSYAGLTELEPYKEG